MGRARIISFINYKGGVGKTTTTYHIGCSLACHHGQRVLLVDIDPQTNLTFLCVEYNSWFRFKRKNGTIKTLYDRFRSRQPLETKRYIWQSPIGQSLLWKVQSVDLIPCDLDLLGEDLGGISPKSPVPPPPNPFQALKKEAKAIMREWLFLKQALSEVEEEYDYILIDCPPNIYMMTQNALVASDWYVVTTIPEYLSTIGLQILVRKVNEITKRVKDIANLAGSEDVDLAILGGIIFVKVRVGGSLITSQHYGHMQEIRRDFQEYYFESFTTELIGYSEAAEARLPVWLTDTSNARRAAAKMEYENITNEFLRRFS